MGSPAHYNVIVIGGGASGLAAALSAARAGARVAVLERDVACGIKLLATGNGRCNLSNIRLDSSRYNRPEFVSTVMGTSPEDELRRFFDSVGIVTATEEDRLYPHSFKAESVRDALLTACRRLGIELICGADIHRVIQREDGLWDIRASVPAAPLKAKRQTDRKTTFRSLRKALEAAALRDISLSAESVVIATGGSTPVIAQELNVPYRPCSPVLCPVAAEAAGLPDALGMLDGLRAKASVTLRRDKQPLWSEEGEVLFRAYGISGVVAFNLSRRVQPGDTVLLDFFPHLDKEAFLHFLTERTEVMGPFSYEDPSWFDGMLAPALAACACDAFRLCHPESSDVKHLVSILKHFKLNATGLAEQRSAQVMRGGIDISAVHADDLSLTSPGRKNLFACGEALDIDADCGGFNLAWAWLTGLRAGASAVRAAIAASQTTNSEESR